MRDGKEAVVVVCCSGQERLGNVTLSGGSSAVAGITTARVRRRCSRCSRCSSSATLPEAYGGELRVAARD